MHSKSVTASILFLTIVLPSAPATAEAGGLSVSGNGRHLLKDGRPFFWLGDTAWFIMRQQADYRCQEAARGI